MSATGCSDVPIVEPWNARGCRSVPYVGACRRKVIRIDAVAFTVALIASARTCWIADLRVSSARACAPCMHAQHLFLAIYQRREAVVASVVGSMSLSGAARAEVEPRSSAGIATPPDPRSTLATKVSEAASPLPAWASEFDPFPEGLFGEGKDPVIRWQPYGKNTDSLGTSLAYPSWLEGTWQVKYLKQGAHFPAGLNGVGLSAAGIEKGSILRLPDVGAEPQAQWRFSKKDEGDTSVYADWGFTLPSIVKAFLGQVRIGGVQRTDTLDGPGLEISYAAPSGLLGQNAPTERTATLTWLAGDTWQDPKRKSFLSVEWQRQRGQVLSFGDVFDYKVLTVLRQVREGQIVGIVRVASFLQPTDVQYLEAEGKPVAVFEYQVAMTPAR